MACRQDRTHSALSDDALDAVFSSNHLPGIRRREGSALNSHASATLAEGRVGVRPLSDTKVGPAPAGRVGIRLAKPPTWAHHNTSSLYFCVDPSPQRGLGRFRSATGVFHQIVERSG